MPPGRGKGKGKGKSKRRARDRGANGKTGDASEAGAAAAGGASGDVQLDRLMEQARHAVDTLEPELGLKFYLKAMELYPHEESLLDEAGDLMMQMGLMEQAGDALRRSAALNPDAHAGKWLYLAQLAEGKEALGMFRKAQTLLVRDGAAATSAETKALLGQQLSASHCSVAELYMTDLCMEDGAEEACEAALRDAMAADSSGHEPLQALASLRLSQRRREEAREAITQAYGRLKGLEPPPEYEVRVAMAKLLLECSDGASPAPQGSPLKGEGTHEGQPDPCEQALELLSGVLLEDEDNVEVWYLMGVAFFKLEPPDCFHAREHLERAAGILAKVEEQRRAQGEDFPFGDEARLVKEQLGLVAEAEAEAGGAPQGRGGAGGAGGAGEGAARQDDMDTDEIG